MEKTVNCEVTVTNTQGLHARPAHTLVEVANRFQSTIELKKEHECVDAKSILSVLTLAAVQGTRLNIRAVGPDADEAIRALSDLFQRNFDDERNDQE